MATKKTKTTTPAPEAEPVAPAPKAEPTIPAKKPGTRYFILLREYRKNPMFVRMHTARIQISSIQFTEICAEDAAFASRQRARYFVIEGKDLPVLNEVQPTRDL